MHLATCLRQTAERHPLRTAVAGHGRRLTYAEWDARTDALAGALAARGVTAGDRVALLQQGGEPLASLHLAAQKIGAVSVPLSTRLDPAELAYCVEDSGAGLLVTDDANAVRSEEVSGVVSVATVDELDRLAREAVTPRGHDGTPGDLSVMLYTSGTTGRPKGVPRRHRAEHAAAVAHVVQTRQDRDSVVLGVAPMFHTMGLRSLLASIVVGGTWVSQPVFDAEESARLIDEEGVTSLYLVPTMYWSLLRSAQPGQLRSVTDLAYAGAAMTPALAQELIAAVGPRTFVNHFGSTEIYTFTTSPDVAEKPGCAGRPGVFARVRLIAPEAGADVDEPVGPGEQGQVIVAMTSPEAFEGYWGRPDADERAIRDGWYHTGDLAVADDDGDLWVSGRTDDMINSGGENVYPDQIEAVLSECQAVDDVCVVGLPDDRWGRAVAAFVVAADGVTPQAAADATMLHAREHLPSLKRPKRVLAVDAIPRSGVGKTLRRKLHDGDYTARGECRA